MNSTLYDFTKIKTIKCVQTEEKYIYKAGMLYEHIVYTSDMYSYRGITVNCHLI